MQNICLVACVKSKLETKAKAEELYTSALFKKTKSYAQRNCDKWYILSAKYGLLETNTEIAPYEVTLNNMSAIERKKWAKSVSNDLLKRITEKSKITFLAGEKYREHLIPILKKEGHEISIPMKGLPIGGQLSWLNDQNTKPKPSKDLNRFYSLMKELKEGLGGYRYLHECNGKMNWPRRGVYFIFEEGEHRAIEKNVNRVVRVGTHAVSKNAKSTFWNRLITHRGTEGGRGNHRGSIFRLHIGNSLQKKAPNKYNAITWGNGQTAPKEIRENEKSLEEAVSTVVGRMKILWLAVNDTPSSNSDRSYIEKNCIGLLTAVSPPLDPPNKNWLGCYSTRERIKKSGLWNLDYYQFKYDPSFLEILERYVKSTIGISCPITKSIAPKNWKQKKRKNPYKQMLLF